MAKEIKNVGASVRAKLLQLSKTNGQSFDLALTRFALERFLFRLSKSRHADRFVLKGGMLLISWFDDPHRGTRDLDLLGFGDSNPEQVLATFHDILREETNDGVTFDTDALQGRSYSRGDGVWRYQIANYRVHQRCPDRADDRRRIWRCGGARCRGFGLPNPAGFSCAAIARLR